MIFLATRGCHCCRGCQTNMDGDRGNCEARTKNNTRPAALASTLCIRTLSACKVCISHTHTHTGAQAWHGGLGGSVLGARCPEDASSFGAVVSQPLHGDKHVRSGHFPTSPTLTPSSQAVALVRNNIPTSAFSSTRAFSYLVQQQ